MRGFDRIDEWKLLQVALQTASLVEVPTIWPIFCNFRQRCHSDDALSWVEHLATRFRSPSSTA